MGSYCGIKKHCPVRLLGEAECETFECACHLVASTMEAWDPETLTVWCCKLYPTKELAEQSYEN